MNETVLATALALRRAGKLAEAAAIYSEILREQPKHFEALHALGILRYQFGALDEAERLIAEAVLVNPNAADALFNRGSLLLKLNRLEDALACFNSALLLKPDYAEALGNRGAALMKLDRYADALADFERLVQLKPALPQAWSNRGSALMKLNRHAVARASYDQALVLRPDHAEARKARGALAFMLGNYADALSDADAVLASHAADAIAWELRANALAELGRPEAAVASYEEALRLKPANADAFYNRANNLMALRRFEEAARDYSQALRIAPDYPYARGYLAFCKLSTCDWHNLEQEIASVAQSVRAGIPVSPFHALLLCPGESEALTAARAFTAQKYRPQPEPLWKGEIYRHDKIRLAYLSADFHAHATAFLIAGVFEHHDRKRFETNLISFGLDDKSEMRTRLMRGCDCFLDVAAKRDSEIAAVLRQMEIDIVVDLKGFTEGCRPGIFSHRAAPVQVNYLGYPGTMGADYIDYILADAIVIPPEHRQHYSEHVVYLPDTYQANDSKRRVTARTPARAEAGLPERGFVFASFNNSYKITPAMFDIWMRLLRDVDASVLWLLEDNAVAVANLKRAAEERGVSAGRLVFALRTGLEEHLARQKLADLFLDTLPCTAHTTASDALFAGLPVVTTLGSTFVGRVAASLLRALSLPELIAPSPAEYETLALRLARDPAQLASVKAKLVKNREIAPLFDTGRFTHELEKVYQTMWERTQRRLEPESFAVEAVL